MNLVSDGKNLYVAIFLHFVFFSVSIEQMLFLFLLSLSVVWIAKKSFVVLLKRGERGR